MKHIYDPTIYKIVQVMSIIFFRPGHTGSPIDGEDLPPSVHDNYLLCDLSVVFFDNRALRGSREND